MDVIQRIAEELAVNVKQVSAAVNLLDEGATVPFISRYRKEVTGGLDDTQLRLLEERLGYLRELNARRKTILDSIASQGKLTPELEKAIIDADTKTLLEDLYLPYKPKRRTKAQIAREAGLEPLADALLDDRSLIPEQVAEGYHRCGKRRAGCCRRFGWRTANHHGAHFRRCRTVERTARTHLAKRHYSRHRCDRQRTGSGKV